MTGWQWFWTLVGFLLLILVLIFLYFFQPFEDLFTLVLNGVSYSNAIFWVALIIGIIGFARSTGMLTKFISFSNTVWNQWF